MIMEYKKQNKLLTRCQKKRYEQGYDIFQEFYIKIIKERRAVKFFFLIQFHLCEPNSTSTVSTF